MILLLFILVSMFACVKPSVLLKYGPCFRNKSLYVILSNRADALLNHTHIIQRLKKAKEKKQKSLDAHS